MENIWPNKVEYSISIPSKAIPFGSFIRVDFKLIPLLKGLVIGNITTSLKEEQEFIVDPEWGVAALGGGQTKTERMIAHDSYTIDAEAHEQILDEAAEGYQFTRFLELPKTLNKCLQDCNVKGIKIRHKVKFNVQLHNPDGHISELRANLPVSFYISPSLPINEDNDLVDQSPQASKAATENDLNHSAPPTYGDHTLDKLYSEVDPSGYLTPAIGLSTPGTPGYSRQTSSDNLRSLNVIANGNSGTSTPNSSINAAALEYRLQNLHIGASQISQEDLNVLVHPASETGSRRTSPPPAHIQPEDYFAPNGPADQNQTSTGISPNEAATSSASISRRVSEEDGQISGARTPFPQYAHMEDLARVPSYSTAVKAPAPRTGGGGSVSLPSYGAVMTGTSPELMQPPTAHVSEGFRSRNASVDAGGPSGSNGRVPTANRNVASIQDDERRLRLMQMRGR